MKIVISTLLLCLFSMSVIAQEEDVTRFLGIPVDGTKSEMIQKLKAKGFRSNLYAADALSGEFNGADVNIHIGTNNNKVYRIMVADANMTDERNIQIRFNRLCWQFENNSKYTSLIDDQTIPDDEDIAFEMKVHNKRYQASFYQNPIVSDSLAVLKYITDRYSAEQLENMTEELQAQMLFGAAEYLVNRKMNKSVWFMIAELYGEYYILMYYDNKYNQANGEDL